MNSDGFAAASPPQTQSTQQGMCTVNGFNALTVNLDLDRPLFKWNIYGCGH